MTRYLFITGIPAGAKYWSLAYHDISWPADRGGSRGLLPGMNDGVILQGSGVGSDPTYPVTVTLLKCWADSSLTVEVPNAFSEVTITNPIVLPNFQDYTFNLTTGVITPPIAESQASWLSKNWPWVVGGVAVVSGLAWLLLKKR
jgi:hypothetical protein